MSSGTDSEHPSVGWSVMGQRVELGLRGRAERILLDGEDVGAGPGKDPIRIVVNGRPFLLVREGGLLGRSTSLTTEQGDVIPPTPTHVYPRPVNRETRCWTHPREPAVLACPACQNPFCLSCVGGDHTHCVTCIASLLKASTKKWWRK